MSRSNEAGRGGHAKIRGIKDVPSRLLARVAVSTNNAITGITSQDAGERELG
jgi:hypothetical protein